MIRNTNKTDSLYFYGVNQTTGEPQFTLNATQEVKNFDIEEQFLPWKPAEQVQQMLMCSFVVLCVWACVRSFEYVTVTDSPLTETTLALV